MKFHTHTHTHRKNFLSEAKIKGEIDWDYFDDSYFECVSDRTGTFNDIYVIDDSVDRIFVLSTRSRNMQIDVQFNVDTQRTIVRIYCNADRSNRVDSLLSSGLREFADLIDKISDGDLSSGYSSKVNRKLLMDILSKNKLI